MIGAKYIDRGKKIIIPLSLPMFCNYYDYGYVYEVIPSKITEDVLKWFECDGMDLQCFSERFYLRFVNRTCAEIDKDAENLNYYAIKEQQSDEYRWAKRMNEKLRNLVKDRLKLYTDEEIDALLEERIENIKENAKFPITESFKNMILNEKEDYKEEARIAQASLDSLEFCLIYDFEWVWNTMTELEYEEDRSYAINNSVYREYNSFGNYDEFSRNLFLAIHPDKENKEIKDLSDKLNIWIFNCNLQNSSLCSNLHESICTGQENINGVLKKYHEAAYKFYSGY